MLQVVPPFVDVMYPTLRLHELLQLELGKKLYVTAIRAVAPDVPGWIANPGVK